MDIINAETRRFIAANRQADVRQLALRGTREPEVDLPMALQQIQGYQTALRKLPLWAATEGILFPVHLSMEQCSSEQAARYKLQVVRRLLASVEKGEVESGKGEVGREKAHFPLTSQFSTFYDFTGGFGVDFTMLCDAFDEATFVERDAQLFAVSSHNLEVFGKKVNKICADGTDVLHTIDHATMIFLDPARRDHHGARTYGLADCTPDVLQLRDELLRRARYVLLKLSPMLDWRKAVSDLGASVVREVHAVSVGGECKELLLVLSQEGEGLRLFAENDGLTVELQQLGEGIGEAQPQAGQWLYEPNASVMKLGGFAQLEQSYGVSQVAVGSHLFVGSSYISDFPGRAFRIKGLTTLAKGDLRATLGSVRQANITVRNFPLTVAELRRKLKIGEGGNLYLFATTLAHGKRVLILTEKAG